MFCRGRGGRRYSQEVSGVVLPGCVVAYLCGPCSPSGKILRRVLRDQAELEVNAAKAVKSKL